jgi:hypothetical protein
MAYACGVSPGWKDKQSSRPGQFEKAVRRNAWQVAYQSSIIPGSQNRKPLASGDFTSVPASCPFPDNPLHHCQSETD